MQCGSSFEAEFEPWFLQQPLTFSESHGSESHGSGSQDDVLGARGLSKPEILGLTGGGHGRRQVKALVFIEEKLRAA